jgi:small conductance mechanosensitive channel
MRGYAYHKAEYGIAYRESIDEAISHLEAAFEELTTDPAMRGKILEPIRIPGVTELGASSVNIRVQIKTAPGEQWNVGRAYNRLVKMHFDAAGIEIPFPHTTIYFGEDKSGKAPPVYVQKLGDKAEPAS